jgi:hypothetical protein
MAYNKSSDEGLERVFNYLADSILQESDDSVVAESRDAGEDPEKESERTRTILRNASQKLEKLNRHLANLGHTINPTGWQPGWSGYHNTCMSCGSFVSFKIKTGETRGDAFDGQCPERRQYANRKCEASRK